MKLEEGGSPPAPAPHPLSCPEVSPDPAGDPADASQPQVQARRKVGKGDKDNREYRDKMTISVNYSSSWCPMAGRRIGERNNLFLCLNISFYTI